MVDEKLKGLFENISASYDDLYDYFQYECPDAPTSGVKALLQQNEEILKDKFVRMVERHKEESYRARMDRTFTKVRNILENCRLGAEGDNVYLEYINSVEDDLENLLKEKGLL